VITKDELERVAKFKRISVRNAEKDYILDLGIFASSEFKDTIVLKGGTALYKFHGLNRFSEDLDFAMNKRRFEFKELPARITETCSMIGIKGKLSELRRYPKEANIRLSFRGPLYAGQKSSMCNLTLNISLRERPVNVKRELYSPVYSDIPSFEVYVLEAEEMLAEKVRAVLTRDKPRDIYDVWFLLKRGVKFNVSLIDKKLRIYKMTFNRDMFYKKIEEKEGMWVRDLKALIIGSLPEFEAICHGIKEMIEAQVNKEHA